MSYFINNQQRLNDVIFSGRNKDYGAYALRSAYGNTLLKSLSIVFFGFTSVMGLAWYISNRNNAPDEKSILPIDQIDSLITTVFEMKPEEPVRQAEPASTPPATTAEPPENTAVTIVDSTSVETHSVLNDEPAANPLAATTSSSAGTGETTGGASAGNTAGSGNSTLAAEPSELIFVDSEPEFEGGLAALYKYISGRIHYPERAADENKQGVVYVKFVVDEKGKVGSISLRNNIGYGMDDEAMRVVSLLPNFKKPAMIKGHPVKVYYQLPIRFKLR